jgi:hypothetical protein
VEISALLSMREFIRVLFSFGCGALVKHELRVGIRKHRPKEFTNSGLTAYEINYKRLALSYLGTCRGVLYWGWVNVYS